MNQHPYRGLYLIAAVLLLLATATRSLFSRWRGRLMSTGNNGKRVLGALLMAVGLFIITGYDRKAESVIVAASPDWVINATTAL